MLLQIWNPELYHRHNGKKTFFEGWYFKIVDKNENNVFAVIPGISFSKHDSHSFIQILDGKNLSSFYHRYSISEFNSAKNKFEICIGKNFFSSEKIVLDLNGNGNELKGELSFKNLNLWPKTFFSPGAMGWFSFVPFMECYHGVVSLYHNIEGKLFFNKKKVDFSGGTGYIEKDWGKSFPSSWIWMQSNHFGFENTSLMVSIAKIPYLGKHFTGFIIGFLCKGKFYKFATYTNAKLDSIETEKGRVNFQVSDNKNILQIESFQNTGKGLPFPVTKGGMKGIVEESLSGLINLKLINKKTNEVLFSGTGSNSGIEINGTL